MSAPAWTQTGGGRLVLHGPLGVLCDRLRVAAKASERVRGLLGRDSLEPGEGLLLPATRRVHTFGMRFPVDVLFCDGELEVLGVHTLGPNRLSRRHRRAGAAIELKAGAAAEAGVIRGSVLRLEAAG